MYSIFVGIDIAKTSFEACILIDGKPRDLGQFSNEDQGFSDLLLVIDDHTDYGRDSWFVCFENTGAYSKPLLSWLHENNIPCREENAMRIYRSLGLNRGKDDKSDARNICMYAYRLRDAIQPTQVSSPIIQKIKKLLSRRSFLVKKRTACQTSIKALSIELDPSLLALFSEQHKQLMDTYEQQIKVIEDLIENSLKEDDQINKNYQLAQSVKGIGPITSAYMIAFTHNFEHFETARQFACYTGIAPFPNRSGTSIRGKSRVSPLANKHIKGVLSNGAATAIIHDAELKIYYQRKRAEGKAYGTVINAVKNKLVQRVFAVIDRQSPYIPLATYA